MPSRYESSAFYLNGECFLLLLRVILSVWPAHILWCMMHFWVGMEVACFVLLTSVAFKWNALHIIAQGWNSNIHHCQVKFHYDGTLLLGMRGNSPILSHLRWYQWMSAHILPRVQIFDSISFSVYEILLFSGQIWIQVTFGWQRFFTHINMRIVMHSPMLSMHYHLTHFLRLMNPVLQHSILNFISGWVGIRKASNHYPTMLS